MEKVMKILMTAVKILAAVLLTGTLVCGTLQVVTRYVLGSPLTWTEQASRYLFIWLVALGIPLAFYEGGGFKFDILIQKVVGNRPKLSAITDVVVWAAMLAFPAYYFYWSLQLVIKAGGKVASGIPMPFYFLYGAQTLSMGLLLLVVINDIIKTLKARKAAALNG